MTKPIGFQLIAYSLLLAGISYLVHRWAPSLSQLTFVTGLAGGGVCLVFGFMALLGYRGKGLSILALIPITFVMLSQTVLSWGGGESDHSGRYAAARAITFLFLLSTGMLARIAYAGIDFNSPADTGRGQKAIK